MRALNPDRLLGKLGSFWYNGVDEESSARLALVRDTVLATSVHSKIQSMDRRVRDQNEPIEIENVEMLSKNQPVLHNGAIWYSAVTQLPIMPFEIHAGPNKYHIGIDFIWSPGGNTVLFKTKPDYEIMVIRYGKRRDSETMLNASLYNFSIVPPAGHSKYVARYLRGEHTASALQDALRAQLGLKRVEVGGTLQQRNILGDRTEYAFDDEFITVRYVHEKPDVGDTIAAGAWLGAEICEVFINDGTDSWYRGCDWSTHGLDLTAATGVNGLVAQDNDETVVANVQSSTAVGVPLTGLGGAPEAFWGRVADREAVYGDLTQKYPLSSTLNPIDLFFTDFLDHAMIIRLDARVIRPGAIFALHAWIQRNMIFGYLPIVRVVDEDGVEMNFSDYAPTIVGTTVEGSLLSASGFFVYNGNAVVYDLNPLIYQ
jgi:hypothetical protein